eukprot:Nk52_evm20s359 gene=Nk52_evmTU20s359
MDGEVKEEVIMTSVNFTKNGSFSERAVLPTKPVVELVPLSSYWPLLRGTALLEEMCGIGSFSFTGGSGVVRLCMVPGHVIVIYGDKGGNKVVSFDNVPEEEAWGEAQMTRMSFLLHGNEDAIRGDVLLSFHQHRVVEVVTIIVPASRRKLEQQRDEILLVLIFHEDGSVKVWRFSYEYRRWDFLQTVVLKPFQDLQQHARGGGVKGGSWTSRPVEASLPLKLVSVAYDISNSMLLCSISNLYEGQFQVFSTSLHLEGKYGLLAEGGGGGKNMIGPLVKIAHSPYEITVRAASGYFLLRPAICEASSHIPIYAFLAKGESGANISAAIGGNGGAGSLLKLHFATSFAWSPYEGALVPCSLIESFATFQNTFRANILTSCVHHPSGTLILVDFIGQLYWAEFCPKRGLSLRKGCFCDEIAAWEKSSMRVLESWAIDSYLYVRYGKILVLFCLITGGKVQEIRLGENALMAKPTVGGPFGVVQDDVFSIFVEIPQGAEHIAKSMERSISGEELRKIVQRVLKLTKERKDVAERFLIGTIKPILESVQRVCSSYHRMCLMKDLVEACMFQNPVYLFALIMSDYFEEKSEFCDVLFHLCEQIAGRKESASSEDRFVSGDSYPFKESFQASTEVNAKVFELAKTFLSIEAEVRSKAESLGIKSFVQQADERIINISEERISSVEEKFFFLLTSINGDIVSDSVSDVQLLSLSMMTEIYTEEFLFCFFSSMGITTLRSACEKWIPDKENVRIEELNPFALTFFKTLRLTLHENTANSGNASLDKISNKAIFLLVMKALLSLKVTKPNGPFEALTEGISTEDWSWTEIIDQQTSDKFKNRQSWPGLLFLLFVCFILDRIATFEIPKLEASSYRKAEIQDTPKIPEISVIADILMTAVLEFMQPNITRDTDDSWIVSNIMDILLSLKLFSKGLLIARRLGMAEMKKEIENQIEIAFLRAV